MQQILFNFLQHHRYFLLQRNKITRRLKEYEGQKKPPEFPLAASKNPKL